MERDDTMSESKNRMAVVWRKSVYDTNHCPKCGAKLIDEDTQPINVTGLEVRGENWLFCEKCNLPVAFVVPYFGTLPAGARGGHWKKHC